jgi:Holliday junction resolvase RusA-like endonuclease
MLITLPIKPLSVNDAWKGKRFKTDKYKRYERDVLLILPKNIKVPVGRLCIRLEFGFSSMASDWDNPIKAFVDILQKKYGFDDKRIKLAVVAVQQVKKGGEYVKFHLDGIDNE